MTTKAKDGRETLQERLRKVYDPLRICREAADALDAAQAEIARLEDKILDIEGVWPDWASKLLDIVYPRECRAAEDEFDLPEDLKEWLAQCEIQVRKAANRPAPLPVAEDVVERAKRALAYEFPNISEHVAEEIVDKFNQLGLLHQPEAAPDGWRPIETAPHGKRVLLAWKDWRDGSWIFDIAAASHGQRFNNGDSSVSRHGSATHWMLIPPAPDSTPAPASEHRNGGDE